MCSVDKLRTINFGKSLLSHLEHEYREIDRGYNANILYIGNSSFYK